MANVTLGDSNDIHREAHSFARLIRRGIAEINIPFFDKRFAAPHANKPVARRRRGFQIRRALVAGGGADRGDSRRKKRGKRENGKEAEGGRERSVCQEVRDSDVVSRPNGAL